MMMEDTELKTMRNQIAILKEKLEKESLVNERLLHDSMRYKVGIINLQARKSIVCAIIAIVAITLSHFMDGLSWAFVIVTILMMLFCVFFTWWTHRPINRPGLFNEDVATVVTTFKKVKKIYHLWLCYVTPLLVIPWISWACYEYNTCMGMTGRMAWIQSAFLVGGALVGGLIGLMWHKKVVRTCDDVISQLEV